MFASLPDVNWKGELELLMRPYRWVRVGDKKSADEEGRPLWLILFVVGRSQQQATHALVYTPNHQSRRDCNDFSYVPKTAHCREDFLVACSNYRETATLIHGRVTRAYAKFPMVHIILSPIGSWPLKLYHLYHV